MSTTYEAQGDNIVPVEKAPRTATPTSDSTDVLAALVDADKNWKTRLGPLAELIERQTKPSQTVTPTMSREFAQAWQRAQDAPVIAAQAFERLEADLAAHLKQKPHQPADDWETEYQELVRRGVAGIEQAQVDAFGRTWELEAAGHQSIPITGESLDVFQQLSDGVGRLLFEDWRYLFLSAIDGLHGDIAAMVLRKNTQVLPSQWRPHQDAIAELLAHPRVSDGGPAGRAETARREAAELRARIHGIVRRYAYDR